MRLPFRRATLLLAATLAAGPVLSQERLGNRSGLHGEWNVYRETDPVECLAVSVRVDRRPARDRQAALFISFKPAEPTTGQVIVTAGAPFLPGSTVTLSVDGTQFTLLWEGTWAWATSSEQDARIIETLKAGRIALLTAQIASGTIQHEFSLVRFEAALEQARSLCAT